MGPLRGFIVSARAPFTRGGNEGRKGRKGRVLWSIRCGIRYFTGKVERGRVNVAYMPKNYQGEEGSVVVQLPIPTAIPF